MGKYIIRPQQIDPYSPGSHQGTVVNRRLVGETNVGAKSMEVVLGTAEEGSGVVQPHQHEVEQAVYFLEGKAYVEIEGEGEEVGAGDMVFFPAGKMHRVVTQAGGMKCLVIYAPPLEKK